MDDHVKFFTTTKYDRLGKWQDPILEAVHRAIPDAKATFVPLPQGNVGLWVTSAAFDSLKEPDREARVRAIVSSLGAGVVNLLSSFHLYTPAEVTKMDRTASFNECFQALQSRLSGPIRYRVFSNPSKHSIEIETPDGTLKAVVHFMDDFLDKIKGRNFHIVAGVLYENGLLTALSKLAGLRTLVVSANGVEEKT